MDHSNPYIHSTTVLCDTSLQIRIMSVEHEAATLVSRVGAHGHIKAVADPGGSVDPPFHPGGVLFHAYRLTKLVQLQYQNFPGIKVACACSTHLC